jgi:hypothetical protein
MLMRFLFQLILWTLFFYLLFKILRLLFGRPRAPQRDRQSVNGQPRKKSLDLSNADIEDAKFREVKKEK